MKLSKNLRALNEHLEKSGLTIPHDHHFSRTFAKPVTGDLSKDSSVGKTKVRVRVFIETKSGQWTIWTEDGKRHIGYRTSLTLSDVQFHVDQKKRARVKMSGKRLPHAWATGVLIKKHELPQKCEVTYNPFTHAHFRKGGRKISKTNIATFSNDLKVFTT